MADLTVDFAALDAAEADLRSTAERLRRLTGGLSAELAPLVATWTGDAADAYAERQRRWDRAAADLLTVLDELRARLVTARDNHASAVRTNRAIWSP